MEPEPEAASFLERIAKFARERVAPGAAERDRDEKIPRDLFRELGKIGLLGALLPRAEGGRGLDMRTLVAALRTLARDGRDASLSIALLPTFMLANFHLPRAGSAEQKRRYLPRLLSGDCLSALAFSELPHGANPKHLETRAERSGDGWVIEGKKAFVTNGPEADLFVVLAVTSWGDRKGFTSFLVERETPGLTIGERMPIPFVRAAPHCTLLLEGCAVPDANRLGALDGALDAISGSTRTLEDLLGAASFAGQMALVTELAAGHRRSEVPAHPDLAEALGELRIGAEAMRLRAERLAEAWDQGERGERPESAASEAFTATLLGGRAIVAAFRAALARTLEGSPPRSGSDLERAVRDLEVGTIGGAANRARIRRLGERLAKRSGA